MCLRITVRSTASTPFPWSSTLTLLTGSVLCLDFDLKKTLHSQYIQRFPKLSIAGKLFPLSMLQTFLFSDSLFSASNKPVNFKSDFSIGLTIKFQRFFCLYITSASVKPPYTRENVTYWFGPGGFSGFDSSQAWRIRPGFQPKSKKYRTKDGAFFLSFDSFYQLSTNS